MTPDFAALASRSWSYRNLFPEVLRLLPPAPARVLDLGCGTGLLTNELSIRGYQALGIDVSPDRLAAGRRAFPNLQLMQVDGVVAPDVGLFDAVVSVEVIEHVVPLRAFVRTAFDSLRPGGTLILTTPYHGWLKNVAIAVTNQWDKHHDVLWEEGHLRFFSMATLGKLLREGGFEALKWHNVGRVRWLWTSMIVRATRPHGGAGT